MNSGHIMKINESLLWINTIITSLLGYYVNINYIIVLIYWIIIMLCTGNAKRIEFKNNIKLTIFIRRSIYTIPLLFPLVLGFKLNLIVKNLFLWTILGAISGSLFSLIKLKDVKIYLSAIMIASTEKREKSEYLMNIIYLIVAAICEEIFFRNFMIAYIPDSRKYIVILLSSFMFFLSHFGQKWSHIFNKYDFLIQIIFSIASAVIFIMSNSIIPCIIMHIIYNFPLLIYYIKQYNYHYMNICK